MTVQILDTIAFDEKTSGVLLTPLGFDTQWVEEDRRVDRVPLLWEGSTALQRGYTAHWAVRERELWLVSVHGRFRLKHGQPVRAEWVSGELRIGLGAPPDELYDAYMGIYRSQIRLDIDEGLVAAAWRVERLL
ncbi:hypothetical protein [Hydrogenophaga sp.]|uniref:hypothetical protein n=1 Tax=Hydrogenophaga sp. TaxID=1904254 RepID=UPI00260555AF|nr:hypothetical protein [Hydrogenophaga sp.]MCW5653229.1 hypothetical protein [Hydrogenophaga sp.]